MHIDSVELSGFRSFKHPTDIKISSCGELAMMSGTNGAGKSSVWDALVWCLYGKTARGLKSSAIKCWEGHGDVTVVSVQLRVDGAEYEVTRVAGPPNSLALRVVATDKARHVDQSVIDDLLGVDYECFLHSAILGQFNSYFFDVSPTEKLNLFSRIMDLTRWENASKRAKEEAAGMDKHIARLETAESRSKIELDRECEHLVTAMMAQKKHTKERKVKIANCTSSMSELTASIEQQTLLKEKADGDATAFQKTVEDLAIEAERLITEYKQMVGDVSEASAEVRSWERKKEEREHELSILATADSQCPVCMETLTASRKTILFDNYRARVCAVVDQIGKAREAEERCEVAVKENSTKTSSITAHARKLKSDVTHQLGIVRQHERAIDQMRHQRDAFAGEIKTLGSADDPYTQMIKQHKRDVDTLKKEFTATMAEVAEARKVHSQLIFWVKGFRNLRLWLVDQALREFEIEVNNSLMQLGLPGWTVTFDVERQTKKGTVSKGFTVMIQSPTSPDGGVPYECWSGGETQRLRIAGEVGLCNLIRARTGNNINIEVWDEPTKNMNQEGIDDLVEFLRQRAHENDRNLWLVDHHSLDAGQFDRVVRIVKDEDGSRVPRI